MVATELSADLFLMLSPHNSDERKREERREKREKEREKETQMRPNPSHFRHTTEHNTTQEKLNRALAKSTDLTFQEKKKKII